MHVKGKWDKKIYSFFVGKTERTKKNMRTFSLFFYAQSRVYFEHGALKKLDLTNAYSRTW